MPILDADVDLSDLLPKVPLEELMMRSALGLPGQPAIEVGLAESRYGEPRGRPWSNRRLALQRALGGVEYPASRLELIEQTRRWLTPFPDLIETLVRLPDAVYGGELEVLGELALQELTVTGHSARAGNDEGSSANQ
ncbi:MAG TPA: hypothetical protein VMV23_06695 [Candidatus Nanopelagicaceae bacterium]|nr:hypothetical protein [Candidatus Nanopelagicaceae bacterium]